MLVMIPEESRETFQWHLNSLELLKFFATEKEETDKMDDAIRQIQKLIDRLETI